MEITHELEVLKASVDRVKKLLDNPEPGLWSWNAMLLRACEANLQALKDLGVGDV